jgi:hypothetical protein
MLRTPVSKRALSLISLGLLLGLAVMTAALRSKAAQSDEGVPFSGTLTVQFVASQICAPGDTNCTACTGANNFYVEAQGIGDTSLGTQFIEVLKCFDPNGFGGLGSYTGTLTTTAPNGKDSLTWAYSGQNTTLADFYGFGPFDGTLTIAGGMGKFEGAHGRASFTAASGPTFTAGPSPIQYAGTAFYSVHGKVVLPADIQ